MEWVLKVEPLCTWDPHCCPLGHIIIGLECLFLRFWSLACLWKLKNKCWTMWRYGLIWKFSTKWEFFFFYNKPSNLLLQLKALKIEMVPDLCSPSRERRTLAGLYKNKDEGTEVVFFLWKWPFIIWWCSEIGFKKRYLSVIVELFFAFFRRMFEIYNFVILVVDNMYIYMYTWMPIIFTWQQNFRLSETFEFDVSDAYVSFSLKPTFWDPKFQFKKKLRKRSAN